MLNYCYNAYGKNAGQSYILTAIVCLLVVSGHATASSWGESTPRADQCGTLSLIIENDVLAGTDRHYTNGLQLAWFSAPHEKESWIGSAARLFPFVENDETTRTGFYFGQEIYTPNNTETEQRLPNQRPYAGWLYAGLSVSSNTDTHFDVWRLNIGTVGPSAYGEDAQNGFHRIIHSDEAKGWDNQLGDLTGFTLSYERGWRYTLFRSDDNWIESDIVPNLGFTVGNIQRFVSGGLTLRLGKALEQDFGPPRIRPAVPGSAYYAERQQWGWYLFVGAGGRWVDHNVFIDDHPDGDWLNIEKKSWVYDAQAGFAVTVDRIRLTYTFVYRSEEFERQNEPDKFASIGLSFKM